MIQSAYRTQNRSGKRLVYRILDQLLSILLQNFHCMESLEAQSIDDFNVIYLFSNFKICSECEVIAQTKSEEILL